MSSRPRRVAVATAAVAGALAGAIVTLALTGPGDPSAAVPAVDATDTATATAVPSPAEPDQTGAPPAPEPPATLLVWTSGGLPPQLEPAVAGLAGVDGVALVRGDQAGLLRSTDATGATVDITADGWQIPLDVLAIEPATFAGFVEPAAAPAVAGLRPGEALLTETSAELRQLGAGAVLELTTGQVTIAGTIDDRSGAGAELVVHAGQAEALGVAPERYLLISHTLERAALQQAVADRLGGRAVRFRSPLETEWLRHGDAVAPMAVMKRRYGEFAFRDRGGRAVEVDPQWSDRWIVTEAVPVLGSVTCHREVIEPLRAAMAELAQANLDHLVDPSAFAGCYAPRRIGPGQPLSHHAWGAAVDLNVDDNPRGRFSTQDQRLVETMRRHGWTWGGTWLVPDPAHYEAPAG